MKYVVKIEGQEIEVPDEVGSDDNLLRSMLAPYYPGVMEAGITRVTKDDVTTVTVIKKSGTKGGIIESLLEDRPDSNPLEALIKRARSIRVKNEKGVIRIARKIQEELSRGSNQEFQIQRVIGALKDCEPEPSNQQVEGF